MNKLLKKCDSQTIASNIFFQDINEKYGDVSDILNKMDTPIIYTLADPVYSILAYLTHVKDEIYDKFKFSIIDLYNTDNENICFNGSGANIEYILRTTINKLENQPPIPSDIKVIYYSINSNKNIIQVDLDKSYIDFLISINSYNTYEPLEKEKELEKIRIVSSLKNDILIRNYNKSIRELYSEGLFPPFHIH
jgi:hypothetical protein